VVFLFILENIQVRMFLKYTLTSYLQLYLFSKNFTQAFDSLKKTFILPSPVFRRGAGGEVD